MVDPKNRKYQDFLHVGPGNIEGFSGRLLDNVKTVGDENLISNKFHFFKGDVIYGKINPQLGKYIWANFEGLSSADTYVLNSKNNKRISQGFIFYLLQTQSFFKYSTMLSMRTGMPKINRRELSAYLFEVPSIAEQRRIVDGLSKIDNLIVANERQEKIALIRSAQFSPTSLINFEYFR